LMGSAVRRFLADPGESKGGQKSAKILKMDLFGHACCRLKSLIFVQPGWRNWQTHRT